MRSFSSPKNLKDRKPASTQLGFTYLGVLFAVFLMSVGMAGAAQVWHTAQKREKERELLFVGHQFRLAIANYYNKSPGAAKVYPKELSDLLLDKRSIVLQRHLRKLYPDPMTNSKEWGLVKTPDERIMGIYSLSEAQPIKTANFAEADAEFEDKEKYSEWKFVYLPQQVVGTPATKPGATPATGVVPGAGPAPAPGALPSSTQPARPPPGKESRRPLLPSQR